MRVLVPELENYGITTKKSALPTSWESPLLAGFAVYSTGQGSGSAPSPAPRRTPKPAVPMRVRAEAQAVSEELGDAMNPSPVKPKDPPCDICGKRSDYIVTLAPNFNGGTTISKNLCKRCGGGVAEFLLNLPTFEIPR